MHPAPSVIIFTVFSGLGFGLLAFLGIGVPAVTGWLAFAYFLIAFGFAVTGLLASTFHLGNPQRALRAFTQWKTSWLSREAWLSVAALLAMGAYAFAAVFLSLQLTILGWIGAALSLATVLSTSMIYAQLKTVPRWNQPATPLHFLAISLAGGAVLAGAGLAALILLAAAALAQVLHWTLGDKRFSESGHTIGTATGLGSRGDVRLFEPPHTGTNYLMKELVHKVGRKHARKLRVIAFGAMFVVPVALLVVLPVSVAASFVAGLVHLGGTLASRWLFFAEAEHVVGLYYGRSVPEAAE